MRTAIRAIALALVAIVLGSGTAAANDVSLGGIGGALAPMESADIRLEAETVQGIVYNDYAHMRVDFKFVNRAEPQTLTLGFPFALEFTGGDDPNRSTGVAGFQAWVDGSRIPVRYSVGRDGRYKVGYYTHDVTFRRGVTMVRVEYLVDASEEPGGVDESVVRRPSWHTGGWSMLAWYPYWVHTGAGWVGTIGKTVIRFRLSDDSYGFDPEYATRWLAETWEQETGPAPGASALDSRTLQWCYEEYEPQADPSGRSPYDVMFAVCEPLYPDMARSSRTPQELRRWLISDVKASSELERDGGQFPPFSAFGGVGHPWGEAARGSGKGEWVEARFGAPRPIEEIRVVTGRAQRPDLFEANARPKTLKVTFSDGTSQILNLKDTPTLQRFVVPKKTSASMRVKILDVYPGKATQDAYLTLVDAGLRSPAFEGFDELLASASVAQASEPSTQAAGAAEDVTGAASATSGAEAASVPPEGEAGDRQPLPVAYVAGFVVLASAAGYVAYRRRQRSGGS